MKEKIKLDKFIEDAMKSVSIEIMQGCFNLIEATKILSCSENELTLVYPVKKSYLNPLNCMQGGLITSAFDNTYGGLCYTSLKKKVTTIDIDTSFHKPIYLGDELTVKVSFRSIGWNIAHLVGEAYNAENQLIASSTSCVKILKEHARD